MKKKIYEMFQSLEALKNETQALIDEGKVDEAKEKMKEVKALRETITMQEELDAEEEKTLKEKATDKVGADKTAKNANIIRAMLKKVTGRSLTEAENSLLLPTTAAPTGANGESYVLPDDVRTIINKKIRQYKSLRTVLGYIPTSALTGSFPIENFETVTGLVDFADGTDGTDTSDIKFTNVKFSLKEKAAFIKLSNTLINLTDNALIEYVSEVFAKKAMVTENTMAMTVLKNGKTAKSLSDWKALKSSLNIDLDPAALAGTVIVTNQDGFDELDKQLDTTGRPILQPDPTQLSKYLFKGYPVEVFSNSLMPSTETGAPVFYGALADAVKFVDLNGSIAFATSSEAGFMSNTTIARLIEFVDVVQCDSSDKCYCYGELAFSTEG